MAKKKKRKKKIKKKKKTIRKKLKKKSLRLKKTLTKTASKETKDGDGNLVLKVSESWSKQAYVNKSQYEKKYK